MMTELHRKVGGIAAIVLALALTSCFGLVATTEGAADRPMSSLSASVATGRKLFLDNCAHCHGADARGDDGPDLHNTLVTDEEIADRITHGVPHQMPSFAKKLHTPEIVALTAYIRSLQ